MTVLSLWNALAAAAAVSLLLLWTFSSRNEWTSSHVLGLMWVWRPPVQFVSRERARTLTTCTNSNYIVQIRWIGESFYFTKKKMFFFFVSFAIDFLNDSISDQPTCIPLATATSPSLSFSLAVSISLRLSLSSVGWQIESPLRMGMDNDVWSHWIVYVYVTQTMTHKKDVK